MIFKKAWFVGRWIFATIMQPGGAPLIDTAGGITEDLEEWRGRAYRVPLTHYALLIARVRAKP